MKKEIYELPEGVRIKLIYLNKEDAHYGYRKDLVGKEYESIISKSYSCTAFRQKENNRVYVFARGAKYRILKTQPA